MAERKAMIDREHDLPITAAPRIKPTSIFLRSARRPNPGRGSTYRRGIFVQTTGTSSVLHAKALPGNLRVPTKPAMHSNLKPAGYSDRKPATLGVNRMGRFDDVVEG